MPDKHEFWQGFRNIQREGLGFRSFYRGNGVNVLKNMPEIGMKMLMNESLKDEYMSSRGKNITFSKPHPHFVHFLLAKL